MSLPATPRPTAPLAATSTLQRPAVRPAGLPLDALSGDAPSACSLPCPLPAELPIFLVGMMGAGKTTVGRKLAQVLGRRFIDLDHELEARCGVRIATIFDIEGEAGFRKREAALLADCAREPQAVIATGGGVVLAAPNRAALRAHGLVIYLHASVDKLHRRTRHDRNRPLLANADPRATLSALLAQREPLYREVADVVIDTGTLALSALVQTLAQRLLTVEKTVATPDGTEY